MAKATTLYKAYMSSQIPPDGGFIISSFFDADSVYTIYEVTAYKNVKDIYEAPEGLIFRTDGNRTYLVVEPAGFPKNYTEPVSRREGQSIPYRFNELNIFTGIKKEKIMVPIEPKVLNSSFTVLRESEDNFSFLFWPTNDVYVAMKKFMADSLFNDCGLPKKDAQQGVEMLIESVKKFTVWGL